MAERSTAGPEEGGRSEDTWVWLVLAFLVVWALVPKRPVPTPEMVEGFTGPIG